MSDRIPDAREPCVPKGDIVRNARMEFTELESEANLDFVKYEGWSKLWCEAVDF
ncbi:hypothetical protein NXC24_PC01451 (plasmid) [Rhizobium sp. NXC24]|nr:hypothetical protein NXC24_PC01451 [Rhizobium sp. NXC24]